MKVFVACTFFVFACTGSKSGTSTDDSGGSATGDSGGLADGSDGGGSDTCPYEDAGGFYTGGDYNIAFGSFSYSPRYHLAPTAGEASSLCVKLNSDAHGFTWSWPVASIWMTWVDPVVTPDFNVAASLDCVMAEDGVSGYGRSQSAEADGFGDAPVEMFEYVKGDWIGATALAGNFTYTITCYGSDCDGLSDSLGYHEAGNFTFTATVDFQATLNDSP